MARKLELDSSMGILEMQEEIAAFPDCNELYLNCVDLDLEACSLISKLAVSRRSWKSIELEECTGEGVGYLLGVLLMQRVERVKLTSLSFGEFGEASMFAIAMALKNNIHLKDLVLTLTLEQAGAQIMKRGLTDSSLERLCLWDCRMDIPTVEILSEGLQSVKQLNEFGLVACAQTDFGLHLIAQSFIDHPSVTRLDLRCLASSIDPIANLLEQNNRLTSVDLSFRSGNQSIDVPRLFEAVRNHPSLRCLHLCGNYLTDDDVVDIMESSLSLYTLNLSMNLISDVGTQFISTFIGNNEGSLRRLLLENNPLTEVGAEALLRGISLNTELIELSLPHDFPDEQSRVNYYARLNQGGRRLVVKNVDLPPGLWPRVIERANKMEWDEGEWDDRLNESGRADITYCLLHGPIFFPI
jgi:hypothetical protein